MAALGGAEQQQQPQEWSARTIWLMTVQAALSVLTHRHLAVQCARAAGARRRLAQSPPLGVNGPNGAAIDNNEGWSNNNAKGYSAVPNITCAAPLTDCNYNSTCYDLQTNILFCGTCLNSCDAFSQVWCLHSPFISHEEAAAWDQRHVI